MPRPDSDRNLLFGLLAVQMDFISRDALVAAMGGWALAKHRPIGEILVEHAALDPKHRALLEPMVDAHVERHGGDPAASLAALSSVGSFANDLRRSIADPDVLESIARATRPTQDDPHATRAPGPSDLPPAAARYRKLRDHARGGLGIVSIAHDAELKREVALKEIKPEYAGNPSSQARFLLEAEITGGLEHPGIVPVYGLGHYDDGRPFYAMRFIKGDSLKDAIAGFHAEEPSKADPGARALALQKLLRRFLDVCDAVAYAHSRGVLHRDLKPDNVMVGKYGETLVVDWGLAKSVGRSGSDGYGPLPESTILYNSPSGSAETQPGSVIGTPSYMSPEQAAGRLDLLGPASDVYSLGATLYTLLTGLVPIRGDGLQDVLKKVERGDFPRPRASAPWLDPALEAVCLKAMATSPEGRYPSPRDLGKDIELWLADEAVAAWREPWTGRARRWMRRHRASATAAAGSLVVIAAAAVVAAVVTDGARRNEATARREADERKTEAIEQGRLADSRRVEAEAQRTIAEGRRREALSSAAGAQLDRARALADGGQVGLGMLWTARALESAVQAGNADLARVARANLALDRLRLPALRRVRDDTQGLDPEEAYDGTKPLPADLSKLPAGQRVIKVSPDRRLALAEPKGGPARLFDLADGRVIAEIPSRYFFSSDFGPDSKTLVLSSPDGSFRTIDATSGGLADSRLTLPVPAPGQKAPARPYWIRFLAGGKSFLIQTHDGRLTLREAPTGRALGEWVPIDKKVGIALDRQLAHMAIPTDATSARVWDAATGRPVGVPIVAGGPIVRLILPPGEGRSLWIQVGNECRFFRVADGKAESPPLTVSQWTLGNQIRGATIEPTLFSADGGLVLWVEPGFGLIREVATGRATRFPHDFALSTASFSGDGRLLLTAERRKAVLRDARTGRPLGTPLEASSQIYEVGFTPDDRLMTAITGEELRAYEVEDGRRAALALPLKNTVNVAFRPDGREVAISSPEGIRRWDPGTGRPVGESGPGSTSPARTAVVYSPDGNLLFSMDGDRAGRLVETASGVVRETQPAPELGGNVHARFSPDGTILATADTKSVRTWDTRTGLEVGDPLPVVRVSVATQMGLAFHPKGLAIAAISGSNDVAVWLLPSRQPAFPPLHYESMKPVAVAYNLDGSRLGIGVFSQGKRVGALLVDANTGRTVAELPHSGTATVLAFTPDGRRLITGSEDRTVRVWDARDGSPIGPALRLASTTWDVLSAPDGRSFLTIEQGSASDPSSGRARLWDLTTRRPLGPPLALPDSGWACCGAFAPDSRSVLIGSFWRDDKVREGRDAVIWRLPPPVPDDATPERVTLWAEVVSGSTLAADNSPEPLAAKDWIARNERLKALGGPPVPDPPASSPTGSGPGR